MKAEFYITIVLFPVLAIGLVTWLTEAQVITGTLLIVCWVVAVLVSVVFDAWVSARYTLRRLAKIRQKQKGDHHE